MSDQAPAHQASEDTTPVVVREESDRTTGEERTVHTAATSDSALPKKTDHCPACWSPMWKDAKLCLACNSNRGWIGLAEVMKTTVLGLLVVFLGVLTTITPYAIKVIYRHSETSFAVAGADEELIYLHVMNDGLKAARLRGYQLHFGDLPIDSARLVLSDDDAREGKNYIQPGGTKLGLLAPKLTPSVRTGEPGRFTKPQIKSMLGDQNVTLEMEIQESDDPKEGPWSRVSETFSAEVLHDLILRKIPDSPSPQ